MSLRGKSCRLAVLAAVASVLPGPSAGQAVEPDPHTVLVRGPAALDITTALRGALRKLENPACQQILDDFTDREGRPLREKLGPSTPAGYLARLAHPRRRDPQGIAPLRLPGRGGLHRGRGRGLRLRHELPDARRGVRENALIHEMLHTLGLRENPPSSAEISRRVAERCGS